MVNPLQVFALSFFADPKRVKDIDSGRSSVSLSDITGFSDAFGTPILSTLLELFTKPYFKPPDWLPVLPIDIRNIGDPTAWVGEKGQPPKDPRDDPFYHPPVESFQSKKNGEVIDIREVRPALVWVNVAHAYQISYRTESTVGDPQADVTTVMIPNNPNGKVVSYQIYEDACSLQCAPSYTIMTGIADPTIDLLLVLGFTVNTPDHEGVKSSLLAGTKEGKSTLDSLRAFLASRESMSLDTGSYNKIVIWGYSGGTSPTGHAAEALDSYAPEIKDNVVGALIGGVIANLSSTVEVNNGGLGAGLLAALVWGVGTEYPMFQNEFESRVRPGIKWRYKYTGKTCVITNVLNFVLQDYFSYADLTTESFLELPVVQETFEKEQLGTHSYPSMPMMVYQAINDEFVDSRSVDTTVDNYCKHGSRIDYLRLDYLGHVTTAVFPLLDAIKYIYKFFDGYVPAPCSDYRQATKQSTTYYADHTDQLANLVNGKWEESGLLDQLRAGGYIK